MMNGDTGSVEKKRQRKTNPGTTRLRERKLMQELDAADTQIDENDDIMSMSAVWKKKRAALQLHAKETPNHPSFSSSNGNRVTNIILETVIQPMAIEARFDTVPTSSTTDDVITKDKLLGALALMELSGVEVVAGDNVLQVGDIIIANMDEN